MSIVTEEQQADPATALWECGVCGFVYDPVVGDADGGIAPGTPFDDIPDDWVCPSCGAKKSDFVRLEAGAEYDESATRM